MSEALSHPPDSNESAFSPLARALLDGFSEGLIVFDADGRVVYANRPAGEVLAGLGIELHGRDPELQPRLVALGGRLRPLRVGELEVGAAVFISLLLDVASPTKLADQEKEAIVRALDANHWKLSETAQCLGISRTTLWRRLKAYGLHRDGRGKWAPTS